MRKVSIHFARLGLLHLENFNLELRFSMLFSIVLILQACGFHSNRVVGSSSLPVGAEALELPKSSSLSVNSNSHIVVMGYMPWFGAKAFTFGETPVTPLLSSSEMETFLADVLGFTPRDTLNYGGYSSGDRAVIRQHIAWLKSMHVDAILLDHSNQTNCSFGDPSIEFCGSKWNYEFNRTLIKNIEIIYDEFSKDGNIKIIPLMGGVEEDSTIRNSTTGKIPLREQALFYKNLMSTYQNTNVIYDGKPLLISYVAVAAASRQASALSVLAEFDLSFTTRIMGGFFESQPNLFIGHGVAGLPKVTQWSWWDRYNEKLLPTYAENNGRAEAFTAAVAAPSDSSVQVSFHKMSKAAGTPHKWTTTRSSDWGELNWDATTGGVECNSQARVYVAGVVNKCPPVRKHLPGVRTYDNGNTLKSYFELAKQIKPTFLFIHQFNGFGIGDSGISEDTLTEIEPTIEWGTSRMDFARQLIQEYKSTVAPQGQDLSKISGSAVDKSF